MTDDTTILRTEEPLHETTIRVAKKLLRSWGDMNSVEFRPVEISGLANDLGYRTSMVQLDGAEWLAAILADLGVMPKQRASVFDPNSRFLNFRDGLPVPQRPAPEYVAPLLNGLLAEEAKRLKAILSGQLRQT